MANEEMNTPEVTTATQTPVTETTTPKKKSKKGLFVCIAAVLVLLIAGGTFFAVYNQPIKQFSRAIDSGDYSKAEDVLAKKADDFDFINNTKLLIADKADMLVESFGKGSAEYDEVVAKLADYGSFADVVEQSGFVETIKASKDSYEKALLCEEQKNFLEAIKSYNSVIIEDTENYDNAQEKAEVAKANYSADVLEKAKSSLDSKKYDAALKTLNDAINTGFVGDDVTNARDNAQAEKAKALIDSIGDVTLSKADTIKKAREYYDSLSVSVQKEVTNISVLTDAEDALLTAQAKDAENEISKIGEVTLSKKSAIESARKKFNSYSKDAQARVTNADVLVDAEKKLSDLQVQEVVKAIDAIGTVTLNSGSKIEAAEKAYNGLTADQKKAVTNYSKIGDAKKEVKRLEDEQAKKAYDDAMSRINSKYDQVYAITWYQHKNQPYYINTRSYVIPYIGKQYSSYWLKCRFLYMGDDWVFFKKIMIQIDGINSYTKTFTYSDAIHDNARGDVWEYVDLDITSSDLDMLKEIANSSQTIVRFIGDEHYYDYYVSASDKQAIKDIVVAYEYMTKK